MGFRHKILQLSRVGSMSPINAAACDAGSRSSFRYFTACLSIAFRSGPLSLLAVIALAATNGAYVTEIRALGIHRGVDSRQILRAASRFHSGMFLTSLALRRDSFCRRRCAGCCRPSPIEIHYIAEKLPRCVLQVIALSGPVARWGTGISFEPGKTTTPFSPFCWLLALMFILLQ